MTIPFVRNTYARVFEEYTPEFTNMTLEMFLFPIKKYTSSNIGCSSQSCYVVEEITLESTQVGFQLKCQFCWEKIQLNWKPPLRNFCFVGKGPGCEGFFDLKPFSEASTSGEYPKSYLHVFIGQKCINSSFFFGKTYMSCRINLPEGAIFGASSLHD